MKVTTFFLLCFLGSVLPLRAQEPSPTEVPPPAPAEETPAPAEEKPERAIPVAEAVEKGIAPAETTQAAPSIPVIEPKSTSSTKEKSNALNLNEQYQGIVRVEMAKRTRDYATPWQPGQFTESTGTAFMIGDGIFMTNAHVVADTERLYLSQYADSRKIPARVLHVAHDADLALLKIDDTEMFKDIKALEFSNELPKLEDTVRVIGYPIGGTRLSVTRGIVSRIETNTYAHPQNSAHLTVQVDAAINPGNSGGPAFKDDKVIGVAFQGLLTANSTGYIIPMPVIQRFLKDVQDGSYDKYVDLGVEFFSLENPSMRKKLGLANDGKGVLVGDVYSLGSCDGVLELGDVVLAINHLPVDNSGMIELDGERMHLSELAERSFMGDKVNFDILRKGERLEKVATLHPTPNREITGKSFEQDPRFVTYAGLLFQPLEFNMAAAHQITNTSVMVELNDFMKRASDDKKDIVILSKTLPDEINARFSDYGRRIVTKVNGVELKGLSHLYELLYPENDKDHEEYTVIELAGALRPFVISRKDVHDANERIATKYRITKTAQLNDKQ